MPLIDRICTKMLHFIYFVLCNLTHFAFCVMIHMYNSEGGFYGFEGYHSRYC